MRNWTHEEIEKLRTAHTERKRLKEIANELDRSVTAVNKFLSRSGIRPKRTGLGEQFSKKRQKTQKNKQFLIVKLQEIIVHKRHEYNNFYDAISYLKMCGHDVRKSCFPPEFCGNTESIYLLDGRPITRLKLLLFANKLRVEEGVPIFDILNIDKWWGIVED